MPRLWFVGAVAGLAAGIFTLLVLEVMAALGVPSAVYLTHALASVAASYGTLTGAIRALLALAFAALCVFLGLVFVAIVRDFHGLAFRVSLVVPLRSCLRDLGANRSIFADSPAGRRDHLRRRAWGLRLHWRRARDALSRIRRRLLQSRGQQARE
jgi:hypothetical protein